MSKKSTKVIATLGVVAGLGIAALPLSSYADTATIPVSVNVAGEFTITTDPQIATCTDMNSATLPNTSYGGVTLDFATPTGVQDDDTGICLQSNNTGTYDIAIGTAPSTDDTTALYSVAATPSSATDSQKIPASASIISGTAGWGYKFNGANRGAATPTGPITADGDYVAPTQFATAYASGGRDLGTSVAIPNGVGDYYGITVGAAVSPSHNGQYTGSLVFSATAQI